MALPLTGLVLYIIYIPFLYASMAICKRSYNGYSALTFWVSNLGEKKSPSYRLFNASISIFGFLSFFFVAALSSLFSDGVLPTIGLFFLYLTCLSTFLVGLFPMDFNAMTHERIGQAVFLGVIGSALFTIYPIYISPVIPNWIVTLNLVFLLSVPLLAFSWHRDRVGREGSSGSISGFVIGNKGLWEWISCLSAIGWDFAMAMISLNALA